MPVITAIAAALVVAQASVALADNTTPDGDNTTPVAANPLAFGTVCINSTTNADALVAIGRNGSATGTNTFKDSAAVTVSVLSVTGTGLSATMGSPATINLPSNWTSVANNTMSDAVSSQLTLMAGPAGSFSGSVTYRATGPNTSGTTITRDAVMAVSATVSDTGACSPTPPDTTPPVVNVSFPSPVSGQNGWFNAADVTPVVGTVTAGDDSTVTNISCTGAALTGTTGYGTNTASGTLTVSGDGAHNVSCVATDGASPANTGAAAGSSNTATIKIDTTAPVITDAGFGSGTAGSNGWYVSPVTENFTASDATSGLADCSPAFSQTSSSDGSAVTISSGPCSDNAGNTSTGVSSGPYKIDTTAPVNVSTQLNRSPDSNGWYNHPVDWTTTGQDPASGIASCSSGTYGGPDQTGATVSGTCTDNAGNTSAAASSPSFNYDSTPPAIKADPSQDSCSIPGNNGWCRGTQTAGFSATDNLSGFDSSGDLTESFTRQTSTEGSAVSVPSGPVSDYAGNPGTQVNAGPYKIDHTPPSVAVTGVSDGATYTIGGVPAAGCATADALSGVDTSATLSTTGGPAGQVTVTCSGATDKAGNTANPVSATYTVNYNFSGFFAPVNNEPMVNTGKAGKTYPVKWQLTDANGNYISALSTVKSITYKSVPSNTFSTDPTDALETTATGGTSLRYDSTANQYVYNWATPTTKGSYELFVTFDSGQVYAAYFTLS